MSIIRIRDVITEAAELFVTVLIRVEIPVNANIAKAINRK
jgi:hypothetical protein